MEKVTIIILSFNKLSFTTKCLESFINTDYPNIEIIVVDNNSDDAGIMDYFKDYQKRCVEKGISFKFLMQERNLGCATSRNAAVRLSSGTYLVFLDNDTFSGDPLWLKKIVEFYKNSTNIGIISIKMLYPQHPDIIQSAGGVVSINGKVGYWGRGAKNSDGKFNQIRDVQYYGAACLFMTKELIDEVGFLNENYDPMGFAAIDYSYRVREKGYRIVNFPEVALFHYENTTTMHSKELNYKYYYAKHSVMFKKLWAKEYEKENTASDEDVEQLWEFKPDFISPKIDRTLIY